MKISYKEITNALKTNLEEYIDSWKEEINSEDFANDPEVLNIIERIEDSSECSTYLASTASVVGDLLEYIHQKYLDEIENDHELTEEESNLVYSVLDLNSMIDIANQFITLIEAKQVDGMIDYDYTKLLQEFVEYDILEVKNTFDDLFDNDAKNIAKHLTYLVSALDSKKDINEFFPLLDDIENELMFYLELDEIDIQEEIDNFEQKKEEMQQTFVDMKKNSEADENLIHYLATQEIYWNNYIEAKKDFLLNVKQLPKEQLEHVVMLCNEYNEGFDVLRNVILQKYIILTQIEGLINSPEEDENN